MQLKALYKNGRSKMNQDAVRHDMAFSCSQFSPYSILHKFKRERLNHIKKKKKKRMLNKLMY